MSSESEIRSETVDDVELTQDVFPDGGLRAWGVVAGAFIVQFCNFGYTASYGVYQDFYVREYITNQDPSAISWIGSTNAFLLGAIGAISGRLYDRGYFYVILWGGAALCIFSMFMMSLAKPNSFYQLYLSQGLGLGIAAGTTHAPSIVLVSQYFQKRQALAMTIVTVGACVGSIVHPIMLNNLLSSGFGFGNTVRASAGMVTGLLLISCTLMHPNKKLKKMKEQSGGSSVSTLTVFKNMLKDYVFLVGCFGIFIFSVGYYIPIFYIQLDSVSHGLNEQFAFYSIVIINFASIFGRIVPGLLANRFGVGNLMTLGTGCSAVIIFGMIGLGNYASVVLIALTYGFFSGFFVALSGPLSALLCPNKDELGTRIGVVFFLSGLGGLVGAPISGALLGKTVFTWWRPAIFAALVALAGSVSFGVMVYMLRRPRSSEAQSSIESSQGADVTEKNSTESISKEIA